MQKWILLKNFITGKENFLYQGWKAFYLKDGKLSVTVIEQLCNILTIIQVEVLVHYRIFSMLYPIMQM